MGALPDPKAGEGKLREGWVNLGLLLHDLMLTCGPFIQDSLPPGLGAGGCALGGQ